MATIRTAIELQDNFTGVLYQVINSVNLGLSAMEDLHQTMNSPVDTTSIEAARLFETPSRNAYQSHLPNFTLRKIYQA